MLAFIQIYIAVEEVIKSNKFDQDGFALSGHIIRIRPSQAIRVVDPKFGPLYTNQAPELNNKRINDGMRRDNFKVTCQTKEDFDFHIMFNKRFGNPVLASLEYQEFRVNSFSLTHVSSFAAASPRQV